MRVATSSSTRRVRQSGADLKTARNRQGNASNADEIMVSRWFASHAAGLGSAGEAENHPAQNRRLAHVSLFGAIGQYPGQISGRRGSQERKSMIQAWDGNAHP